MAVQPPSPPLSNALETAHRLVLERLEGVPAWVVLTQLFIGFGWIRAATEKIIDPNWWRGDVIDGFVEDHAAATLGWYEPFLDVVVAPLVPLVALAVLSAQLVAGTSLVTGRRPAWGLGIGIVMNLHFMAAGAVTPSAFYLLAQGALVLWMCEAAGNRSRALRGAAAVAAFVAGANLPFVSTVHPADVIEDPAVMFAFGGVLTVVACLVAAGPPPRSAPPSPDDRQSHPHGRDAPSPSPSHVVPER